MAKQKKFKKIQMPKMLAGAKESVMQKAPAAIVLIIFLSLTWVLVTAFFERSDYFRLKSVEVKGVSQINSASIRDDLLKHSRGNNIFRINLKAIARSLEPQYPDAKDIIVRRALPDKVSVEFNFRRPVAVLSNSRDYPVDREGVILVNRDPAKLKDLPVIKGVDPRYAGKLCKKNESRNLEAALVLLDEIQRAPFLYKYGVRMIDASDVKSLSFYLGEGGPMIIIGYENLKDRLSVLKYTLKDPRLALDRINYIDIRFKDVVISPK